MDEGYGRLVITLTEGQELTFSADGKEFMRFEVMQKVVEVREGKYMATVRARITAPRWITIGREHGGSIDARDILGPGVPDRPAAPRGVPERPALGTAIARRRDRAHSPRGPR